MSQSCYQVQTENIESLHNTDDSRIIKITDTTGKTLITRFNPPSEYLRTVVDSSSFAYYLRHLPLKPAGSLVKIYDGSTKPNDNIYEAVVNLPIGKYDLHQCADAIMRLKAEYLWRKGDYEKIHFNLTNGFRVDYTKWMDGNRIAVKGNRTYWIDKYPPSNTYKDFWKYMELIFSYAGTLSLSKELKHTETDSMEIGDIFIFGGSPGHSVIVVDMATNPKTGEKIFMLAQSYMPAQEIQILKNNENIAINPWYSTKLETGLMTPECYFDTEDLMRFDDE